MNGRRDYGILGLGWFCVSLSVRGWMSRDALTAGEPYACKGRSCVYGIMGGMGGMERLSDGGRVHGVGYVDGGI